MDARAADSFAPPVRNAKANTGCGAIRRQAVGEPRGDGS